MEVVLFSMALMVLRRAGLSRPSDRIDLAGKQRSLKLAVIDQSGVNT